MMTLLVSCLFLLFMLREVLFWVSLWQLKEYRLDRMIVHLKDTRQGNQAFFSVETLGVLLIFLLYFLGILLGRLLTYYSLFVVAFFLYELFRTLKKMLSHKVKRPVFTGKSVVIVGLSFATSLVLLFFPLSDFSVWLVFLAFITPFIVAFYVFLFSFPTEIYTDIVLQRAKKKRLLLRQLKVIAVSGSYGKSSTKEIIEQILSRKFNVVKTPLSQNTPLAVANSLLRSVTAKTDFFIAELGAYKKGEVAQLAQMVKPIIGVTTAVSDQHLALYGSMKDVVASEMELIHEIPKNGFMLLNANSHGTHFLAEQTTRKVVWYGYKKGRDYVTATDIKPSVRGVSFRVSHKGHSFTVSSPLLGVHTVENILPAIFLGLYFGLSENEIIQAIATLKPLPKTMEQKKILPRVTVIDDTFNASPESVGAAVTYLNLFSKRKMLVMSPLIELGKKAKERHVEIGKLVADLDILFLTNGNFLREIMEGIDAKKGKVKVICNTYAHVAREVREVVEDGDAVVFEGKEAGIVLNQL